MAAPRNLSWRREPISRSNRLTTATRISWDIGVLKKERERRRTITVEVGIPALGKAHERVPTAIALQGRSAHGRDGLMVRTIPSPFPMRAARSFREAELSRSRHGST